MFKYNREVWRKIQMAYRGQRALAKKRGIPFLFGKQEWVGWWEARLGRYWYKQRGAKRGLYVMARHLDKGAYVDGNVSHMLHEDNGRSMKTNGTSPVGIKNGQVKLTEKQVLEIYQSTDDSDESVASKYGITSSNVRFIRKGRSWKHLTRKLAPSNAARDHRKKLTDEEVREIYSMEEDRFTIAKKYEVAPITVWEIKHKKKRLKALAGL